MSRRLVLWWVVAVGSVSSLLAQNLTDQVRVVPLPARSAIESARPATEVPTDLAALKQRLSTALLATAQAGPASNATKTTFALSGLGVSVRHSRDPRIVIRPGNGTPMEISGVTQVRAAAFPSSSLEQADLAIAREFLRINRAILRLDDPDAELRVESRQSDDMGRRHVRFSQHYRGIPVWPADLVVHLDRRGDVDLMNGAYIPTPRRVAHEPIVPASRAAARARQEMYGGREVATSEPALIIYAPSDRAPRLAWKVDVSSSLSSAWTVVIDALNGVRLAAISQVHDAAVTGSGRDLAGITRALRLWQEGSLFYMVDTSKAMFDPTSTPPAPDKTRGAIFILDAANQPPTDNPQTFPDRIVISNSTNPNSWTVPETVGAAFWLSETYDYFRERHGRNSLDGAGGSINGVVRYGKGFDNAFWRDDLSIMVFGDGDTWAGSLDFVGHEMSHGVTSRSANLIYQDQSGALNEALSDILGEMIEARTYGSNDWILGSQLNTKHRNMANPAQFVNPFTASTPYPSKMSEFFKTSSDNGGVHINSSIINRAYYLLAAGMPGAIGLRDAERIFYRAQTTHLVQKSEFLDARLAVIRSATELFGAGSTQAVKVAEAFDAVEIFDASAAPGPPSFPQVSSSDSTVFIFIENGRYFLGRRETNFNDPADGVFLSRFDVAQSRPSVSGNGALATFVDSISDVCLIATNGSAAETCLDLPPQGIRVRSVGMSPDASRFGFVLEDAAGNPDNTILVVDLNTNQTATFELYAPAFDSISTTAVAFADAMDFTADGRFLVYDAFNVIRFIDGSLIGAWSIYAVELSTGVTFAVLPPVPGLDIENPNLSQTSDNFLTFEIVTPATGETTIASTNLSTGDLGAIAKVNAGFGVPSYNGDDSAIVFSQASATTTGASLFRQPLAADKISPQGAPAAWLPGASYGTIYRRGTFSGPTTSTGTVQFASSTFNVTEGATATITVSRASGSKGAASIAYTTAGGTASPGSDYTAASDTLSWTDGDMGTKSFQVRVNADTLSEGTETVIVSLSGAGGASLGTPSTATLSITNKQAPARGRRRAAGR